MEKITYRMKDYPHLHDLVVWYKALGRRESLSDQIVQISLAGGGVPHLVVAHLLNKLSPAPELQATIDNLQAFYYAEIEEI